MNLCCSFINQRVTLLELDEAELHRFVFRLFNNRTFSNLLGCLGRVGCSAIDVDEVPEA